MDTQKHDLFAHKSKNWDMKSRRVQNAKATAEAIVKNIKLSKEMEMMDLGAGTGLLSFFLYRASITSSTTGWGGHSSPRLDSICDLNILWRMALSSSKLLTK